MGRKKARPTKRITHLAKPALLYFLNLCSDIEFKKQIETLRLKWGIETLAKSFEEANNFWENLCRIDVEDPNYEDKIYEGKTRSKLLQQDLEQLCEAPNIKLSLDMWHVLYTILLCFDLENVTENDIFQLPLPPSLARISIVPNTFNPIQEHHLYLDVTFASLKDIPKIWPIVSHWQRTIRPYHIKRGYLPDLLKGVKAGVPPIPDVVCLQCAKLKEEGWTYKKMGEKFDFPIQLNEYKRRARCRTAEEAVRRGRKLLT